MAIANDRIYGHDVTSGPRTGGGSVTTVRQSLLRAPLYPDPDADQGTHEFRTVIAPGVDIDGAVRAGYRTNLPPRRIAGAHGAAPIITVDNPAVVVEAVKLAEDRSGDVVVRLYESLGGRARTTVLADFAAAAVTHTDLLERPVDADPPDGVAADNRSISLTLRPFQIVTLRWQRA